MTILKSLVDFLVLNAKRMCMWGSFAVDYFYGVISSAGGMLWTEKIRQKKQVFTILVFLENKSKIKIFLSASNRRLDF